MAVYDDVKRALQDILAPQLAELKGDMNARFAQVETRITELRAEMNTRFAAAESQTAQLRAELRQEINNIHTDLVRIEQVFDARLQTVGIVERVARIEERLARA